MTRSRLLLWIVIGLAVLATVLALGTVLSSTGGSAALQPHPVHSR